MSERVLKLIEPVVKGCRVCRMWARPGQKAAAATRLTTRFNDVLQGDLLFIFDLAVLHLVDEATRWSSVGTLANRTEEELCAMFHNIWINIWGLRTRLSLTKRAASPLTTDRHFVNDLVLTVFSEGQASMRMSWNVIMNFFVKRRIAYVSSWCARACLSRTR